MGLNRLLATAAAATMLTGAALTGLAVPAQAAAQITVTPSTNLHDGDKVTVTLTGFSPKAPVAVGVCPAGRALKGAGDCGPSKKGASKLLQADAGGGATTTLTVIKGPLGNLTPPKATCPPCAISAANIANAAETASMKITFASAKKTVTPPDTKADDAGSQPDQGLPNTGPRETMITALLGLGLLQLGLVFAVRAHRSGARRSAV
jgi:LPXTG-motif cell wall-anchored protein